MKYNLDIKGYTGQLTITQKKIIIQRSGALGKLISSGFSVDTKEIPVEKITAIQFKSANWLTNGWIQFSVVGETTNKAEATDENTILFTYGQRKDFIEAKELLDSMINEIEKDSSVPQSTVSSAGELKKYAELRDAGILTEEEFTKKKNEILNI